MEEKLPQGRGHPMVTRQEEELADQEKVEWKPRRPKEPSQNIRWYTVRGTELALQL